MDAEEYAQRYERNRRREIQDELEKARKRREEREKEHELWEAEKDRLQRLKDSENHEELERKEEEFHLDQACRKSEKRLSEGRPKPIDLLYRCLHMNTKYHYESADPSQLFRVLDKTALEDLDEEIRDFEFLDEPNNRFWVASRTLCTSELAKRSGDTSGQEQIGVHQSLTSDIAKVFQGKSYVELVDLESQITQKLQSGSAGNVEYWETLLKNLIIYKSMTYIRETFLKNLQLKLTDMETESYIEQLKKQMYSDELNNVNNNTEIINTARELANNMNKDPSVMTSNETMRQLIDDDDEVDESKRKHTYRDMVGNDDIVEQEVVQLVKPTTTTTTTSTSAPTDDDLYKKEAEKFVDHDESEEKFEVEVQLASKFYAWHDKYRPRKPKFFNRVHTGYDWSKYNQTHYDHDNPPPKVVQGYKFNIFYPDLIDKTKSPQFFIQPSDDGSDTVILRFHAGPPYEDVAFQIVNREWEHSHKKGYKAQINIYFQLLAHPICLRKIVWFHDRSLNLKMGRDISTSDIETVDGNPYTLFQVEVDAKTALNTGGSCWKYARAKSEDCYTGTVY
eukprot:gene13668-16096_t